MSVAEQTPYKMGRIENGYLEPILRIEGLADCQSVARQMLPMVYWQTGYVDIVRPRAVLEMGSMWGRKAIPFVVNGPTFDMDYPEHVPVVEAALRRVQAGLSPAENRVGKRFPS